MGPQNCKKAIFCQKIAKNDILATLRSHKKTKKQNIKNLTDQKFITITRNIYTKNGPIGPILKKKIEISSKVDFLPKKSVFQPKIGQFLTKFAQILQMNKNHLNTSYVKIVGHMGHFLAFLVIFCHFLAPFGLYNYIGERPAEPLPPLAFTAISSEPLNKFSKCWAFWKEQIKGYQIV